MYCSIYLGILIKWMGSWIVEGYPQFYYTVQIPLQTPYIFTSPFSSVQTINVDPQPSGPTHSFTIQQLFGITDYNSPLFRTQPFENPSLNNEQLGIGQHRQSAEVQTSTAIPKRYESQYRGFAYHTQLTNGARADVFFLTGPKAYQTYLQNVAPKDNFNTTQSNITEKARTLASNSVDSNAVNKKPNQQLFETLTESNLNTEIIRTLLQNPQTTFQEFYSNNKQQFTESKENRKFNMALLPTPGLDDNTAFNETKIKSAHARKLESQEEMTETTNTGTEFPNKNFNSTELIKSGRPRQMSENAPPTSTHNANPNTLNGNSTVTQSNSQIKNK